eukprot:scaffold8814_cov19-Tisochrysis_lutea.AAC.1
MQGKRRPRAEAEATKQGKSRDTNISACHVAWLHKYAGGSCLIEALRPVTIGKRKEHRGRGSSPNRDNLTA